MISRKLALKGLYGAMAGAKMAAMVAKKTTPKPAFAALFFKRLLKALFWRNITLFVSLLFSLAMSVALTLFIFYAGIYGAI